MELNWVQIVAGMTGAQLIDALNTNSSTADSAINELAAAILLRVLGNNIKQLKVQDGKLMYTLDNTNWVEADNNVWGSITGTLTDQTDLANALNEKANQSALQQTNDNVGALQTTVGNLGTTVQTNTQNISSNTTAIGELQAKQAVQVSSDTILSIRLNANGYLEYSLDNIAWEPVLSEASTNWGSIGGLLENQEDLIAALNAKATNTALNTHISDTNNPHGVTAEQVGLGNVDNTADIDKPISTLQQEALDLLASSISTLSNNKLNKTEDIQAIEYITLADYNAAKSAGELSNTTIYIVD